MASDDGASHRTRRPRAAIVTFTNLVTGAGTELTVLNYAKYWDTNRSDLTVVDTDWVFDGVSFLSEEDVEGTLRSVRHIRMPDWLSRFRFMSRSPPTSALFGFVLRPALYWIYGRTRAKATFEELSHCDVVILFDNDAALAFPSRTRHAGARLIGTSHCRPTLPYVALISLFPFSWVHRVDRLQVFTESQSVPGLRPGQLFQLQSGVDTELFRPGDRAAEQPLRFLFAGRLVEAKGVREVLEAWRRISPRGTAELHIVGDGPLRETISRHLPPNVTFHGRLSQGDLVSLYRSCDVFVYPTRSDSFALVVAQALACGMYCIVGDALRGVWDDFVRMGCLEYVDPTDVTNLAARMGTVIRRGPPMVEKKRECAQAIETHYTWPVIVARLQTILAELTPNRGSPGEERSGRLPIPLSHKA